MNTIANVSFTFCAPGSGLLQVDNGLKTVDLLRVRDIAIAYDDEGYIKHIQDLSTDTRYTPDHNHRVFYH